MLQIFKHWCETAKLNNVVIPQKKCSNSAKFWIFAAKFYTMKNFANYPDFNPKEFGHVVGRWRAFKGFTQANFADTLGIKTRTLQSIESGSSNVTLKMAYVIAQKLQVPLDRLLNFNENAIINTSYISQQASENHSNNHGVINHEYVKELLDRIVFLENLVGGLLRDISDTIKKNGTSIS